MTAERTRRLAQARGRELADQMYDCYRELDVIQTTVARAMERQQVLLNSITALQLQIDETDSVWKATTTNSSSSAATRADRHKADSVEMASHQGVEQPAVPPVRVQNVFDLLMMRFVAHIFPVTLQQGLFPPQTPNNGTNQQTLGRMHRIQNAQKVMGTMPVRKLVHSPSQPVQRYACHQSLISLSWQQP